MTIVYDGFAGSVLAGFAVRRSPDRDPDR